jgi:hypothetical protein
MSVLFSDSLSFIFKFILARHGHCRLSYMVKDQYILSVDSIVSYTSIAG